MKKIITPIAIILIFFATAGLTKDHKKSSAGPNNNSKLPIEITSDSLEVRQNESIAIFKGNVIAIQGTMKMNSEVMVVHYEKSSDPKQNNKTDASPTTNAATQNNTNPNTTDKPDKGSSPAQAITQVDAKGNVFITTETETAQGDSGVYYVRKRFVVLNGNVILTSGKNVVKGESLVYNLDTGRSRMVSQDERPGMKSKGRVKSLFVPGSSN